MYFSTLWYYINQIAQRNAKYHPGLYAYHTAFFQPLITMYKIKSGIRGKEVTISKLQLVTLCSKYLNLFNLWKNSLLTKERSLKYSHSQSKKKDLQTEIKVMYEKPQAINGQVFSGRLILLKMKKTKVVASCQRSWAPGSWNIGMTGKAQKFCLFQNVIHA